MITGRGPGNEAGLGGSMRIMIYSFILMWSFNSFGVELGAERCSLKEKDSHYIATFQYRNAKGMQIRLAKKKKWVAEILSDQKCQAICDVKKGSDGIFDLRCQSKEFDPLTTAATLHLDQKPKLKFGTWLQGYRETRLATVKSVSK
jgi:hypothetical protein